MSATVSIKSIVDALQVQSDDFLSFMDLDSGEAETVRREILAKAEEMEDDQEPDDLLEWEEDEFELARRIVSSDRFIRLPSKFDVHEWQIMEDFSLSVSSARLQDELQDAIHGAGAFRCFKSVIRRRGIEQDWYAFRDNALKQIAIDWCEEHKLVWSRRKL